SLLEVAAELILQHAVDALDLLLLPQLDAVADDLRPARAAVLSGRHVALLDGALLGVAALALQEQLHALAAAEAADGSVIPSHSYRSLSVQKSTFRVHEERLRPGRPRVPYPTPLAASAAGSRCADSASRRGWIAPR